MCLISDTGAVFISGEISDTGAVFISGEISDTGAVFISGEDERDDQQIDR